MRARLGIGLLLLLVACGGAASPTGSVECRESVNGVLTVTADSLAFDTGCLALPAGEAVTIRLVNAEGAEPHDVAIYTDSSRSRQLFSGDIVDGGESIDYQIDALEAGMYYFDCTIHPAMNGSVVVQ
ncbi:MAG: cupredoxin domain-containing protein [Chloroflexota bacterium]|nr:cupredoxin domain-containing protein [Chloroflexota bacterium]